MKLLLQLLAFLFGFVPIFSQYITVDDIDYKIINEGMELSVSSKLSHYSGRVVIPENVSYKGKSYKVTSIGDRAFVGCRDLTSIIIPNSVTSIGDGAFIFCKGLTSITIPNSVKSIGLGAFEWCDGLISISIPYSVKSIGQCAFLGCSALTSIVIPNSVKSIGESAFENCSNLTSVNIPNSITCIETETFMNCSGLTSVTIPNSITNIGAMAFFNCKGLTSINIPNSVVSIGYRAFSDCSSLMSIAIPNSVTNIGNYAFGDCLNLISIKVDKDNKIYNSGENGNAIIETSSNKVVASCKNSNVARGFGKGIREPKSDTNNSIKGVKGGDFATSKDYASRFPAVEAKYPGNWILYLQSNLKYPAIAIENEAQGVVRIEFVVGKDGSVSHCKILKNVPRTMQRVFYDTQGKKHYETFEIPESAVNALADEAMRVIRAAKWTPGKDEHGNPIISIKVQEIQFVLQ